MSNKSRILGIFGDSWAYGAELPEADRESQCFGGRLAQLLQAQQVFNLSEPGSAIGHLHLQLGKFVHRLSAHDWPRDVTVIFFLSGHERCLFFDQNDEFAHVTAQGEVVRPCQEHNRERLEKIYQFYYQYMHSAVGDDLNVNVNLLSLQARCAFHGFDDYYVPGWQTLELWPEIDSHKIFGRGHKTCADDILSIPRDRHGNLLFDQTDYTVCQGMHPNAAGHQLIARTLAQMIEDTRQRPK